MEHAFSIPYRFSFGWGGNPFVGTDLRVVPVLCPYEVRGVYSTPASVVGYIVRSVDALLKQELNLLARHASLGIAS